jgi:hypothetical protein
MSLAEMESPLASQSLACSECPGCVSHCHQRWGLGSLDLRLDLWVLPDNAQPFLSLPQVVLPSYEEALSLPCKSPEGGPAPPPFSEV